jgi:IPT/TIG domain
MHTWHAPRRESPSKSRPAAAPIGGLAIARLASMAALASACLPGTGPPLNLHEDDAGSPGSINVGDDGGSLGDVNLGDPFAITGLQPSHGPWTGGTRTSIAGRGFSSAIGVWIGSTQLDPSEVFANSPTRASVTTPPGPSGAADVRIRNLTTAQERTLIGGFFYDAFVVSPQSGATTGGTLIVLQGSGTNWTSQSTVAVGGNPCTPLTFVNATDLVCATPAGSPGSQDVTVTNADGTIDQARDAYVYSDSPDGYRGGLYGGALSGSLTVLAFDSWTGTPLAGGKAVAGSIVTASRVGTFDASGVARLSDPTLTGKVTVTVAAKCHQPITFVDVPVDTVTAYLAPVLDPSCGQGDPPSSGNYYATEGGQIQGELVWFGGVEFQRSGWNNVPMPVGNERQAAYVFATTGNPTDVFQLPPPEAAATPTTSGVAGPAYSITTLPGNRNVYALAGLEDRSVTPPRFEPYAMGVGLGVLVRPGMSSLGVDIPMTTPFDHVVATAPQPPPFSSRGPDRLVSTLAIDVGSGQFAILPQGTISSPLPLGGGVSFNGAPALSGTLAAATYDLTGAAVSGAAGAPPLSVVKGIETTQANAPVTVGGFLAVPTLVQPSAGTWNGTHVTLQAAGAIDLFVLNVSSANGLVTWQIVAPGSDLSFDVPDLGQLGDVGKLVHGSINESFAIARFDSFFDYTRLRYGQLSSTAWSAYALDTATGAY